MTIAALAQRTVLDDASRIAATYDMSTQTAGYRVGQTQRLFAYTAAPPESATTVDVDLGVLGVAKDVPVTD